MTPELAAKSRAGPAKQKTEARDLTLEFHIVTQTQTSGPPSTAFSAALGGSWIRSGAAESSLCSDRTPSSQVTAQSAES